MRFDFNYLLFDNGMTSFDYISIIKSNLRTTWRFPLFGQTACCLIAAWQRRMQFGLPLWTTCLFRCVELYFNSSSACVCMFCSLYYGDSRVVASDRWSCLSLYSSIPIKGSSWRSSAGWFARRTHTIMHFLQIQFEGSHSTCRSVDTSFLEESNGLHSPLLSSPRIDRTSHVEKIPIPIQA